jgi:hypothetical protein
LPVWFKDFRRQALGQAFHRSLAPRQDGQCLGLLEQIQAFLVSREMIPPPVRLDAQAEGRFLARGPRMEVPA